jgi:hypothetical protein
MDLFSIQSLVGDKKTAFFVTKKWLNSAVKINPFRKKGPTVFGGWWGIKKKFSHHEIKVLDSCSFWQKRMYRFLLKNFLKKKQFQRFARKKKMEYIWYSLIHWQKKKWGIRTFTSKIKFYRSPKKISQFYFLIKFWEIECYVWDSCDDCQNNGCSWHGDGICRQECFSEAACVQNPCSVCRESAMQGGANRNFYF